MKKLFFLVLFGISFAFVEAAVVVYLRTILGFTSGYEYTHKVIANFGFIAFLAPGSFVFPDLRLFRVEFTRELATVLMLLGVAGLAGKNLSQKIGAFLVAFALWDLFYYVFLSVLTGWPKNFFDLDVFFLIPVPWIGPVLTPVVISLLLLLFGLRLLLKRPREVPA